MSKQYGLIIPNKGTKPVFGNLVTRPSVFDDDSDPDTPAPSKPTGRTKEKRQDKLNQQKAAEEDPTVYQYDEIYDEMDQKRKDSKLSRKDLDKKPKYINRLLATAERRKRENERRIERQVQKEREAEGEEFKDKEAFVTSAYKKKLEEMKALEEQERREEYLESIGDVTKQGNLDGFYRHLYDQKVLYEDNTEKNTIKIEPKSDEEEEKPTKTPEKDTQNDDTNNSDTENNKTIPKRAKKRKYRTHKDSEEQEEENTREDNPPTVKKEHLQSNLDADSDFSIDSSDSEDEENKEPEKPKTDATEEINERPNVLSDNANISKQSEKEEEKKAKEKEEEIEEKPKKPKIDIWKKRTVGQIYDDAVRRYFERKALREAARNT